VGFRGDLGKALARRVRTSYYAKMHQIDPILDRMLSHLAQDLGYDLSTGELNLYRQELAPYLAWQLSDIVDIASKTYPLGSWPSLAWFKRGLDATLRENLYS
jgi:hypothetical protein